MTIHKEGHSLLAVSLIILLALNAGIYFLFPQLPVLLWVIGSISLMFYLIILQFFRSPSRNIVQNSSHVIAPADGKVVVIEEVEEPEYFKGKRLQVSIFMSPINVHINRNPISGFVSYFKYHPGKYLVAWHPKSSTENERTTIVIRNKEKNVEVLMRQIAGALAKRIKWYIKEGQEVAQGNEFGFIKFGSRVDLYLPLGTEILVSLEQKTVGGETVIAKLK